MRKPSLNHTPFDIARHYRRPLCALRTPLLSLDQREHATFLTWETYPDARSATGTRRERVLVTLATRDWRFPLAQVGDAPLLDHVVSRCLHRSDRAGGYTVSSIQLTLQELAGHRTMSAMTEAEIVLGLRRLTNTLVTLQRTGRRRYPPGFRLLDIMPAGDGAFDILLSDWLEDELAPPSANPLVTTAPPASSILSGIRHRLYGWMIGFAGRGDRHERVIWQSEVLDRLGPLPDLTLPAWDQVATVVMANDLPDFDVELTMDRDAPAIRIRRRPLTPTHCAPPSDTVPEPANELNLDWDGIAGWSEPPARPPEISLEY